MFAVRLGSYSTRSTFAGTPTLSRRKSITRYSRLWPPPLWRLVTWPWWLRPPEPEIFSVRLFSGRPLWVTSAKSLVDLKRVPGVTGLNCLVGILHPLEELDRVALREGHDGLLPRGAAPLVLAHALGLAGVAHGADVVHLHVELLLDRLGDLDLVGILGHHEGVRAEPVELGVALLGHQGPDDHLVDVTHSPPPRAPRRARPSRSPARPARSRAGAPPSRRRRSPGRRASPPPRGGCGPT